MSSVSKTDVNTHNTLYYVQNVAAIGAGALVSVKGKNFIKIDFSKFAEQNNKIQVNGIQEIINKALKNSTLEEKGVKVVDLNGRELYDIDQIKLSQKEQLKQKRSESKGIYKIIHTIKLRNRQKKYIIGYNRDNLIISGKNACFRCLSNEVGINLKKLPLVVFHEIGHAMNFHNSKFWRGIAYSRMISLKMPLLLGLTAVIIPPKKNEEQPKNVLEKTSYFIKKHVGELIFLSQLPIIAEEIKASYNGAKLAKPLLNSELYKATQKNHRIGAISYITYSLIYSLIGVAGSKIRDIITLHDFSKK